MDVDNINYAINQQVPTAHTVCTNCGEIDLEAFDDVGRADIQQALTRALTRLKNRDKEWEEVALDLFHSADKPNMYTITKALRRDYGFDAVTYPRVRGFLNHALHLQG